MSLMSYIMYTPYGEHLCRIAEEYENLNKSNTKSSIPKEEMVKQMAEREQRILAKMGPDDPQYNEKYWAKYNARTPLTSVKSTTKKIKRKKKKKKKRK